MADLISRQDALNFRVSRGLQEDGIVYVPMKEVKEYLRGLPSAQPKRKKGKWIIVTDGRGLHIECSHCGEWRYRLNQKFCGECGSYNGAESVVAIAMK